MKKFLTALFIGGLVLMSGVFVPTAEAATPVPKNTLLPGTTFKYKDSKLVYYIAGDAVAYPFPNQETFLSWFPSFARVKTFDKKTVTNTISKKSVTLKPGARAVKFGNDPKIYAVGRGARLRWITTEKTLKEIFGNNWQNFYVQLPASQIYNYSISDKIEKADQYHRADERSNVTISQELARLKILKKDFTDGDGKTIPLLKSFGETASGSFAPKFNPRNFSYTVTLKFSEERITLSPRAYQPFMMVKVKDYVVKDGEKVVIDVPPGTTEIPVIAYLTDGSDPTTYLIKVIRAEAGTENKLASLSENLSAPLWPSFKPNIIEYSMRAKESETRVIIKAKAKSKDARVFIDGDEYIQGSSYEKNLKLGANSVQVQVVAQDGSATKYTINIQKPI